MESAESEFQAIFKVSSLKLFLLALLGTLLAVATCLVLKPLYERARSVWAGQASKQARPLSLSGGVHQAKKVKPEKVTEFELNQRHRGGIWREI